MGGLALHVSPIQTTAVHPPSSKSISTTTTFRALFPPLLDWVSTSLAIYLYFLLPHSLFSIFLFYFVYIICFDLFGRSDQSTAARSDSQQNHRYDNQPYFLGFISPSFFSSLLLSSLGSIPSSFGTITSLQHLEIAENQLFGTIPITFSALVNMKYLNLGCQEVEANAFIRLSYAVCSFLLLLSFIKVRLSGEKEARKQYEREIEIVVPSY